MSKVNKVFLTQKLITELTSLAKKVKIIFLDTEFERQRTYFAELSIVQFYVPTLPSAPNTTDDADSVYDVCGNNTNEISFYKKTPLPEFTVYFLDTKNCDVLDITDLIEVLADTEVRKVFHSCKQDIEAIYRNKILSVEVKNVIDTQVLANECGLGAQVGYANLVQKFCGITLDKQYQYSKWLKRPIPEELLHYAALDVVYLHDTFNSLRSQATEEQFENALKKSAAIANSAIEIRLFSKVWSVFLKQNGYKLKDIETKQKAYNLCKQREINAIQRNILPRFIMTDEEILAKVLQ